MPSAVSMETCNVYILNTAGNFMSEAVPSEGRGRTLCLLSGSAGIFSNGRRIFFGGGGFLHVDFNLVN